MSAHAILPGMPDWLDKVDQTLESLKSDPFNGGTVKDNINQHLACHLWQLDDEALA